MSKNIVKAKLDVIFKRIFTNVNNEDLLHDFISSILNIPKNSIKNIMIQNSEIPPDFIEGKFSRLDLKLQIDNKLVNVELQTLFELSNNVCYQSKSAIQINLTNRLKIAS